MAADVGAVLAVVLWLIVLLSGSSELLETILESRDRKRGQEDAHQRASPRIQLVLVCTVHLLISVVVALALADAFQLAVRDVTRRDRGRSVALTFIWRSPAVTLKTSSRAATSQGLSVPAISPPAAVGGGPSAQSSTTAPTSFVGAAPVPTGTVPTTLSAGGSGNSNTGTSGNGTAGGTPASSSDQPTLAQCVKVLNKLLVVLLIELAFEFLFVLSHCLVNRIRDLRRAVRPWVPVLRVLHVAPVLLLNTTILWLGSGPNGACLSNNPSLGLAFAHLILYMFIKLLQAIAHFLETKIFKECFGGKSSDDDKLPRECAHDCDDRGHIGWGRAPREHRRTPEEPEASSGYTYDYEEQTAERPRNEVRCCGLFRIEL